MYPIKKLQKIPFIFMSALLVVSLLAGAFPEVAQAATTTCQATHTVKSGETLSQIARNFGISLSRLAKANDLKSPYTIRVGQKLCIPVVAANSSNFSWTPTYNGTQIAIKGSGFKKLATFFVKAREKDKSAYEKVSTAVTDKNGNMNVRFRVPQELRNKPALSICLKDNITNKLVCKRVLNT
jgi:LysM repeat protein